MRSIFDKLLNGKMPEIQFDTLYKQASVAAEARDFHSAIQFYEQALAVDPAHAQAHYKLGNALKNTGRLSAAIESYNRAIHFKPDYSHAFCNRGTVQQVLGFTDAALASYDNAITLDPTDPVAHYNRALILQQLCRWKDALASYQKAIEVDPAFADAQYNRSLNLLFLGDFARGWPAYEWRWRNAHRLQILEQRDFTQPLWLGEESIRGKRLLLYSEAGLGDTLQFCRYAKLCAALGAVVTLEVQAPLMGLLSNLDGVSHLVARGNALPAFDYQCPLMSLPLAFKTLVETIPAARAYLDCNETLVSQWRARLGEQRRPRVGLAWSGNPKNTIDQQRSIRLAEWITHLPPQFEYYCLQRPVRAEDQTVLDSSSLIFSFDEDHLDFVNTAALCKCMDLVISVDTSLAHLSGALGQRTWTLLSLTPDWRWMLERADSPWYPSMKLYRQKSAGDWTGVFKDIAVDLRREFPAA